MTSMTRKARLAVIFGAVAVAAGIGVTLAMTNNQTLAGIFQLGASQEDENENGSITFGQSFSFLTKYEATLLGNLAMVPL
jgi:hypothetical protein